MLPNVKELPGAKFARSRTLEESHFPRIKMAVNPMPVWFGPLQNGATFFRIFCCGNQWRAGDAGIISSTRLSTYLQGGARSSFLRVKN
jgi:hypothetical protein